MVENSGIFCAFYWINVSFILHSSVICIYIYIYVCVCVQLNLVSGLSRFGALLKKLEVRENLFGSYIHRYEYLLRYLYTRRSWWIPSIC